LATFAVLAREKLLIGRADKSLVTFRFANQTYGSSVRHSRGRENPGYSALSHRTAGTFGTASGRLERVERPGTGFLPNGCDFGALGLCREHFYYHNIDGSDDSRYDTSIMTAIAKKLDARLTHWAPETAKKVAQLVAEIIELADNDALDLIRSRKVEQEVLDIIDGRKAG